jgi:hypothetical protein
LTVVGDMVIDAARAAKDRAVLCAPFTKRGIVERVTEILDPAVEVTLFTRWRPEEVAAGVSDTAVLALLENRGGRVFLHDPLHAKAFIFDDIALVGSANLTARALGWTASPNLELLIEVAADTAEVVSLQEELGRGAVRATPAMADEIERVAALLPPAPVVPPETAGDHPQGAPWHPRLREPRELFVAYRGDGGRLSRQSSEAAAADLACLEPPTGLEREAFEALIGTRLLQEPVVLWVDAALSEPRRFGEVRDLLMGRLDLGREEAGYAWQTLMRWLLTFAPRRYSRSTPSHSEILVRTDGAG